MRVVRLGPWSWRPLERAVNVDLLGLMGCVVRDVNPQMKLRPIDGGRESA